VNRVWEADPACRLGRLLFFNRRGAEDAENGKNERVNLELRNSGKVTATERMNRRDAEGAENGKDRNDGDGTQNTVIHRRIRLWRKYRTLNVE